MVESYSWGNYPKVNQELHHIFWLDEYLEFARKHHSFLVCGNRRSYGDNCLSHSGVLLSTRPLEKLISFNPETGEVEAESGMLLKDVISFLVPRGYFVPVTPGTQLVTLGGAVANDIHGKNHHVAGSFSDHVISFSLQKSNGKIFNVTPDSEVFNMTCGGAGLTGFIRSVRFKARKITSPYIYQESIKFRGLEEFLEVSKSSDEDFEYTVAWLDCVSTSSNFARGILMRGRHAHFEETKILPQPSSFLKQKLSIPFYFPEFALSKSTVSLFNAAYYGKQVDKVKKGFASIQSFFHPLDAVGRWNLIYGKRGFLQFQFVLPEMKYLESILKEIVNSGCASFLAVLKIFGKGKKERVLSFPMEGPTLALDFPVSEKSLALCRKLEKMVVDGGGRIYLAKDATMSPETFMAGYPEWEKILPFMDEKLLSVQWKRLVS